MTSAGWGEKMPWLCPSRGSKNTKTNAREKNFKMDIDEKIEDIEENVGQIEVQFQSETGKFEC